MLSVLLRLDDRDDCCCAGVGFFFADIIGISKKTNEYIIIWTANLFLLPCGSQANHSCRSPRCLQSHPHRYYALHSLLLSSIGRLSMSSSTRLDDKDSIFLQGHHLNLHHLRKRGVYHYLDFKLASCFNRLRGLNFKLTLSGFKTAEGTMTSPTFMMAPVLPDTIVADADGGFILPGIDTLATVGGRTIKLYTSSEDACLIQFLEIPTVYELVAARFLTIDGKNRDCLAVLDCEGRLISYDYCPETGKITRILLYQQNMFAFTPNKAQVSSIRELGVMMMVVGVGKIAVFNINTPGLGAVYSIGIREVYRVICLSNHSSEFGFAVMTPAPPNTTHLQLFQPKSQTEHLLPFPVILDEHDEPQISQEVFVYGQCTGATLRVLDGEYRHWLNFGVPFSGLVLFGTQKTAYIPYNYIEVNPGTGYGEVFKEGTEEITAVCPYGDRQFVIATASGRAWLIQLQDPANPEEATRKIIYIDLGLQTVASVILPIQQNLFFGSETGRSYVFHVARRSIDLKSQDLTILQVLENFGPINDSAIAPYKNRLQVLLSCGTDMDGSMTRIENKIQGTFSDEISVSYVQDLFTSKLDQRYDCSIIMSTTEGTTSCSFINGELVIDNLFTSSEVTLALMQLDRCYAAVQVTPTTISIVRRLYDRVSKFHHNTKTRTTLAVVDGHTKRVYTVSKKILTAHDIVEYSYNESYEVKPTSLRFTQLDDVTCIDLVTTLEGQKYLIVGFRGVNRLTVLHAETFKIHSYIDLPNKHNPKSIVATQFDLFYSTETGVFYLTDFDIERKEGKSIARTPGHFGSFKLTHLSTKEYLFAACAIDAGDEGFFIGRSDESYTFPTYSCSAVQVLKGYSFSSCYVIAGNSSVKIGSLSETSYNFPFGENIEKLSYQFATDTVGVIARRREPDRISETCQSVTLFYNGKLIQIKRDSKRNDEMDATWIETTYKSVSTVLILHPRYLQPICGIQFGPYEYPREISSGIFANVDKEFYAVSVSLDYERGLCYGSIVIFEFDIDNGEIYLIDKIELEDTGAPNLMGFKNGQLLAGFGTKIYTFNLNYDNKLVIERVTDADVSIPNFIAEKSNSTEDASMASASASSLDLATDTYIENYSKPVPIEESMGACEMISSTNVLGAGWAKMVQVFGCSLTGDRSIDECAYHGSFFVGSKITTLRSTSALHIYFEEVAEKATGGNALFYGTTTGHAGWIFRLHHHWSRLLKRIEQIIDNSDTFRQKYYLYLPRFHHRQLNNLQINFVDGEKFELLMRMPYKESFHILGSIISVEDPVFESCDHFNIKRTEDLWNHLTKFHAQYKLFHRREHIYNVLSETNLLQ